MTTMNHFSFCKEKLFLRWLLPLFGRDVNDKSKKKKKKLDEDLDMIAVVVTT